MSQHNVNCPVCKEIHRVEVFRSGGNPVSIVSSCCSFSTDDNEKIKELLGLGELHRRRIANHKNSEQGGKRLPAIYEDIF